MARARFGIVAALAPMMAGCVLLGPVVGPVPSPVAAPTPLASDAAVPASLRTAIEPARDALLDGWRGSAGVSFRFARAHCAIGAMVGLVFQQRAPGTPDAFALVMARDIAAGLLFGAWGVRYDVPDPAAEPTLIELIGDNEIPLSLTPATLSCMHRPVSGARRPVRSAVLSLALSLVAGLSPGIAHAQSVALEFVEDPTTGLATVIPVGWHPLGNGIHARTPDASDSTLLAVQSALATPEQLWSAMLPQLRLEEIPVSTGTRQTERWSFDLYHVEVAATSGPVGVDLAVAGQSGTSYLVLLQAPIDEIAALSPQVFLPAVDALTLATPEPTPDPDSLPYTSEEVTFPGGDADVTLAGTLTVPRTPGPHPAVVLVGGSGAQDRDESLRPVSAIKPLAIVADALSSAGLAVLRYDDRGVAASTGDFGTAGLEDFTDDLAAALDFARSRSEVDPARLGALGHSEGGIYIASLIEAGVPLAFAVGMAPPATTGVDLLVAQNGAIARSSGVSEEEAALAEGFAANFYAHLLAGDAEAAAAIARDYQGGLWDRQPPEVQASLGERATFVAQQVTALMATAGNPWFLDVLRSDAAPGWDAATMPVLGIFGGKDVQVLADQNAPLMEAQLADGHPASRVVTLPDANHLFQSAVTGGLAEYGTLDPAFTPDFLPLLVSWVAEVTGASAPESSPAA